MSFEAGATAGPVSSAINYLQVAGTLPVAASGNDGCGVVNYPAKSHYALAVGALTADSMTNRVTSYTSTGAGKPDLVAQGDAVRSSWLDNQYAILSGTSMASPAVSGVAALVMSADPRWINDPAGVADVLKATANSDVIPPRRTCSSTGFGYGLVDADAAVVQALR